MLEVERTNTGKKICVWVYTQAHLQPIKAPLHRVAVLSGFTLLEQTIEQFMRHRSGQTDSARQVHTPQPIIRQAVWQA